MILKIIGGGLAGCEAAWQAAERGVEVELYEMRPGKSTGAHQTDNLAELVCSNSLGSNLSNRASGLLKAELRRMGSALINCADANAVPAGNALAVDRTLFSECIEKKLTNHPKISIHREEYTSIPSSPAVISSGPLTSPTLSQALKSFTGEEHLFFYDAIAPVVELGSINMDIAFRCDRYDFGTEEKGDYINCPFNKEAYEKFYSALKSANRIPLREIEKNIDNGVLAGDGQYFQGCQPVEVIAQRSEKALVFGPMRPVGLIDPRTGKRPYAVVQLRQDNLAGDLYNLVGFQTNLTFSEQARVFRLIPGLENASFVRYGQMHRNAYIASPRLLDDTLSFTNQPGLFVAGQLAGIEGYAGNIASGLVAGINAAYYLNGFPPFVLPHSTMTGALIHYITHADLRDFQPMKAIFGILPKPADDIRRSKLERYEYYGTRALSDLEYYLKEINHFDPLL